MKKIFIISFLVTILLSNNTFSQPQPHQQKTWTYTYIKAKAGQKENLRKSIEQNWFVMDSIAVRQGLFNDYQLLENTSQEVKEWDFIVAVEYYTSATYADVEKEWLEIRKNHKNVSIDGYNFSDLGTVVKSETLVKKSYSNNQNCIEKHYDLLKPYLGTWEEYLVLDDKEQEKPYGRLMIELDPKGCALKKHFTLLTASFSYETIGYFNLKTNAWIETYTFNNGNYSIYQWNQDGENFLLELQESSNPPKGMSRNRWTKPNDNFFQIISENSYDGGKTWEVTSTTNMKRKS